MDVWASISHMRYTTLLTLRRCQLCLCQTHSLEIRYCCKKTLSFHEVTWALSHIKPPATDLFVKINCQANSNTGRIKSAHSWPKGKPPVTAFFHFGENKGVMTRPHRNNVHCRFSGTYRRHLINQNSIDIFTIKYNSPAPLHFCCWRLWEWSTRSHEISCYIQS